MATYPTNCKVLVTGGTGSIGREIVAEFTRIGLHVTFYYHENQGVARKLEEECGAKGVQLDFCKPTSLGHIDNDVDILVNNAGINISKVSVDATTTHELETTLSVNLVTPFILSQQQLNHMKQRGWGRIINISSIYGFRVAPNNLAYNVSKHGLRALTATVAKEYGAYGITCNEICPGPVSSDLLRRIANEACLKTGTSVESFEERLVSTIPAHRLALPSDIAALVAWLASREAAYVNGVSIPLDGGLTA